MHIFPHTQRRGQLKGTADGADAAAAELEAARSALDAQAAAAARTVNAKDCEIDFLRAQVRRNTQRIKSSLAKHALRSDVVGPLCRAWMCVQVAKLQAEVEQRDAALRAETQRADDAIEKVAWWSKEVRHHHQNAAWCLSNTRNATFRVVLNPCWFASGLGDRCGF